MLLATRYTSNWNQMTSVSKFITITYLFALLAQHFPCFHGRSLQEQRQPRSLLRIHVSQQHLLPLKGQDTRTQRENGKTGLEWWRWTMQEGGCQVLWSGILLPTPTTTRSLFLPAMHCSLHLSHYEPRLVKEARQNNETMRLCREAVQASNTWNVVCNTFAILQY